MQHQQDVFNGLSSAPSGVLRPDAGIAVVVGKDELRAFTPRLAPIGAHQRRRLQPGRAGLHSVSWPQPLTGAAHLPDEQWRWSAQLAAG